MAKLTEKEAYFKRLEALNESSDDDQDISVSLSRFANARRRDVDLSDMLSGNVQTPPALCYAASDPSLASNSVVKETPPIFRPDHTKGAAPLQQVTSMASETSSIQGPSKSKRIGQRRTASDPVQTNNATLVRSRDNSTGKKRKKEVPLKMAPLANRVFTSCKIFWIPNDDIDPARRTRIRRALEHGASWVRSLTRETTHIIVDDKLTYQQILDYLKLSSLPKSVQLVNDNYRVDCISFKRLVSPDQDQYRIKGTEHGHQAAQATIANKVSAPALDESLELKPPQNKPGKWDYVPPRATPPRSDDSSQRDTHGLRRISSASFSNVAAPGSITTSHLSTSVNNSYEGSEAVAANVAVGFDAEDELEKLIREMKQVSHLPLDDDDLDPFALTVEEGISGNESDEAPKKRRKEPRKKGSAQSSFSYDNFSCMKGGNGKASNPTPNDPTIDILQQMADHYGRVDDKWRLLAYRRVISVLRQQQQKITTFEDAFALPFIGERLALKIEEIATTNRLRRLEYALSEPGDEALQLFLNIYGVGINQASRWVAQGHKTLQDLLTKAQLTANQRIGIERYDDFLTRIPRAEVTALGEIVQAAAASIDPMVHIIIGGSYRRGAQESGDIDCIVTKPGTDKSSDIIEFLGEVTQKLTNDRFLVAALSVPRSDAGSKWHGCCTLPNVDPDHPSLWRRIDFLLVPEAELGAALIYFTGNDIFNRSIRLLASKKGMRLNQRGLYKDVMRGPGKVKVTDGDLMEGADERKIFELLGVPWRDPKDRNC